jgi:hypothetical protein
MLPVSCACLSRDRQMGYASNNGAMRKGETPWPTWSERRIVTNAGTACLLREGQPLPRVLHDCDVCSTTYRDGWGWSSAGLWYAGFGFVRWCKKQPGPTKPPSPQSACISAYGCVGQASHRHKDTLCSIINNEDGIQDSTNEMGFE